MSLPAWLNKYYQIDLFGKHETKMTIGLARVVIGQFYEILFSQYCGGYMNDQNSNDGLRPDVIVDRPIGADIYEVKSGRKRIVSDCTQWEYYNKLKENNFPYHKPNIYYALFWHTVKDSAKSATVSELINKLSNQTIFGIIIPLEKINIIMRDLNRRFYRDNWGRVKDTTHHIRINYTEFKLNDMKLNLKPRKYLRLRNIEIAGNKVKQFPFYKYE